MKIPTNTYGKALGGLFFNYNIAQLHSLISEKITFQDIVEECIKRTKQIDPIYKCLASFDEEDIQQLPKDISFSNENKKMIGVPVGVKDIFNTKICLLKWEVL